MSALESVSSSVAAERVLSVCEEDLGAVGGHAVKEDAVGSCRG